MECLPGLVGPFLSTVSYSGVPVAKRKEYLGAKHLGGPPPNSNRWRSVLFIPRVTHLSYLQWTCTGAKPPLRAEVEGPVPQAEQLCGRRSVED